MSFIDPRVTEALQKKKAENAALLNRTFDRVIGSQLAKIQEQAAQKKAEDDAVSKRG
jgi:hypothetical protein